MMKKKNIVNNLTSLNVLKIKFTKSPISSNVFMKKLTLRIIMKMQAAVMKVVNYSGSLNLC